MPEMVILPLPDAVLRRAQAYAEHSQHTLEEVLLEWLDRASSEIPVTLLPDEDVLALSRASIDDAQQEELSRLIFRNHEGLLDDAGKARLDELMIVYRHVMARKTEAIKVALERGLGPLLG
jgi:hypothetical protein